MRFSSIILGIGLVASAAAVLAANAGDPVRGERLFARCSGCHAIQPDENRLTGPSLHGIVGRDIAGAGGFNYSPAFQQQSGQWSRVGLDAFLANPREAVPGTRMLGGAVQDAVDRADIVAYLATLR